MIKRNTIGNLDKLLIKIAEADTDNFAELCSMAELDPLKELKGGDLRRTNLDKINLEGAVLSHSDFRKSSLVGANLKRADLSESDLSESDLSESDLRGADLRGANLKGADLRGANLKGANLIKADLTEADLKNAKLEGVHLTDADITNGPIGGEYSAEIGIEASASKHPKQQKMEIIEEKQGGINIFKLNGRLDSNTSQGFEQKVFQAISDGSKTMVVDFKDLDYISSAGLRVILKATKAINREEGKITLCAMQDDVREIFEIVGFDPVLSFSKNLNEAVEMIKKSSK